MNIRPADSPSIKSWRHSNSLNKLRGPVSFPLMRSRLAEQAEACRIFYLDAQMLRAKHGVGSSTLSYVVVLTSRQAMEESI